MDAAKPIYVDILPWTEESLTRVSDVWQRLLVCTEANPSVSLNWSKVVVEAFEVQAKTFIAVVFAGEEGEEAVAIWPYMVGRAYRKKLPIREVKGLSSLVSYHPELLSVSYLDKNELIRSIFCACDKHHGIDCLVLGTNQHIEPPNLFCSETAITTSPYVPIKTSWTDFIAAKPKKFRYKVRQRKKMLEQTRGLRHEWIDGSTWRRDKLDHVLSIERKSWKAAKGIAIGDRPQETRYYELLLPFLARERALSLDILFNDNEPIAYNLCCCWKGWHGQLKTSFDQEAAKLSPGSTIVDIALQRAFDSKAIEFDFLGNEDSHKMHWTDHVRSDYEFDLSNSRSVRGIIIGKIQQLQVKTGG